MHAGNIRGLQRTGLVKSLIFDYLFVTEETSMVNLQAEGVDPEKVFSVNDVRIDSLEASRRLWIFQKS